MTKKLYITNLDSKTTQIELSDLFTTIGTVVSAQIALHPATGLPRNYGFVEMETPELAKAAAEQLNNYLLHDKPLYVSVVLPREMRKPLVPADLSPIKVKPVNR